MVALPGPLTRLVTGQNDCECCTSEWCGILDVHTTIAGLRLPANNTVAIALKSPTVPPPHQEVSTSWTSISGEFAGSPQSTLLLQLRLVGRRAMSWLAPWAFPPNGKTDESFPNPKSEFTYKENFQTSCHCLLVLFTSKLNKMTSKIKPKRNKSWQEAINILPANGIPHLLYTLQRASSSRAKRRWKSIELQLPETNGRQFYSSSSLSVAPAAAAIL